MKEPAGPATTPRWISNAKLPDPGGLLMAAFPRARAAPATVAAEERNRVYRRFDLVVAVLLFFLFMGLYHVVTMLTVGDWDFWDDWKDSRWWISFTPVAQIAMPAAVVYIFWARFRLPFAATLLTFCLV